MRSAGEHDTITGVISLGLLASRLQLSLLNAKEGASFQGDKTFLRRWTDILEETVNFIESPGKRGIASGATTVSPRFLARADYLVQLRSAAPPNNSKTPIGLAAYLRKISNSVLKLEKGGVLPRPQREILSDFVSSIARGCVQEASRLQQEPHPKWSHEPMLMLTKDA